jgi:murein DD-endopeptidase MepM/ murein hydrolase activator NlpD
MNPEKYSRLRKIISAWLILFVIQLACGSVAPTDPRIPESINYMVWNFGPWLDGIGIIPLSPTAPPVITNISPEAVSGLGSIGTGGVEPAVKLRLYRIEMRGCGNEPARGNLLAETTVAFGGTWSIPQTLEPGVIVGATQVLNGTESGLSNLRINLNTDQLLVVNSEDQIQQTEHDISQNYEISGTSFPGACVVLLNQNMDIGRVGSVSVPVTGEQQGRWRILVPLQTGENRYRVFIEGWDEIKRDYVVRGYSLSMQWPVGKKDGGNFVPSFDSAINAFYGRNDYYYDTPVFNRFHDGIDLSGEVGTPVLAATDGDVFYIHLASGIQNDWDGGNIVFIDHGGWFSVYMHLSRITIDGLDTPTKNTYFDPSTQKIHVQAGEKIGEMGNSGLWKCVRNCLDADRGNNEYETCCTHLHFSAYQWSKGNRTATLKDIKIPPFQWYLFGQSLNVNPPKEAVLKENIKVSDRLKGCAGTNYLNVNWTDISVTEFGYPSGTEFTNLGEDQACTVP